MAVKDFYTNVVMRNAVKDYLIACFEKEAVELVFKREDVSHIADAKELLDKAFEQMAAEFGAKPPVNNSNPARWT